MLAAAVAVVSAQAASVSWTARKVQNANGDSISGIAYFVNAAILSQNAFSALNGASAFTTALDGMYSWTPTTAGTYTKSASNTNLGLSDATADYSVYLAIFDTATITDSSNYFLTSVKALDTLTGTETASISWGSLETASKVAGAWSSVKAADPEPPIDSPEPTSGLLMLIGAAGLALRRKRA